MKILVGCWSLFSNVENIQHSEIKDFNCVKFWSVHEIALPGKTVQSHEEKNWVATDQQFAASRAAWPGELPKKIYLQI